MVEYADILNLSRDELLEEYCKLFDRFEDLRESSEADTQKIHELKRSLDTATAAQAYLSQELELYTNADSNQMENELHKVQTELVEVKKKCNNLEVSFADLKQDYSALSEENSKLIKDLEESLKCKEQQLPNEDDTKIVDDYISRIQILECENMDLLQKIGDSSERDLQYTFTIAEYEKNIEILKDQIVCLEENLQSKRVDLEEKMQILESTQEKLAEANAKIAMISMDPENNDRKGNSLFAEVDDQRQAMRLKLATQKKHYMEMKKIHDESQDEIRRLKRENISMHTELEACSAIFCNADKIYQEKLNERIHSLLTQNEELEQKLKWTQERLKELAAKKGVLFLDSMLSFCKKETDDLKSQLHRVRIQNASLEEQLRNSQQDMARWRFESLKSRCVLADREHLLTEHKIAFKSIDAVEFNINVKDERVAKPRIVTKRRSSLLENVHRKSTSPSKVSITQESTSPQQSLAAPDIFISNDKDLTTTSVINEEKIYEKELSGSDINEISIEEVNHTDANSIPLDKSLTISKNKQENKENNSNNYIDDFPILNNFAKLKLKPLSPMRPSQRSLENPSLCQSAPHSRSILTKQNDSLSKESCKNVKFSSEGDTVYNLSPGTPSPPSASNCIKTDGNASTSKITSQNTVKQSRTKSNIIVRRVVVSSKLD